MQDGNLAAQTKWLGTQYDVYGRPTLTGFVSGTSPNPNSFSITYPSDALTETTYDDVAGSQAIYKGKVKQSKVKVLDGGSTFLTTDFTYDAHGRVATTAANNFTGGSDNYTFTYDWADNRLTSSRTHKRLSTDATTTILETATYDHAGRTKDNRHKLNALAEITLSRLNYNHRDELTEKFLGKATSPPAPGGTDWWLQSLDYAYNPQGWLTTINGATLGGTNTALAACPTAPTAPNPGSAGSGTGNPDPNDLFYMELKYDGQFTGMTGDTLQKNGNINQMMWRTRGRERQAYNFNYDFLDRLRSATYADVNDAGTVTANSRFNESLTYADGRGNISGLKRVGGKVNGACWDFAQIDNLTYAYTAGTNKISTITDVASATYKAKGFNPGGGTGSYTYDANGSLKTDPYKSMTIAYNHLNLPKMFTFTGGAQSNTIEILYDAAGTKLRKTVKTGTTTNYTQDYIGGIEYRDGVREAIYTAEGRLYNNGGTNRHEYAIKDHLGNTRLTFTDKDADGVVDVLNTTANEILQENNYYPFGLNTDGPWMNDAALDNKYQYNSKEWNDDFGLNLNDYGARWYDGAVGRWWSVDPLSEKFKAFSPLNYTTNNPLKFIDIDGMDIILAGTAKQQKRFIRMLNRRTGNKYEVDENGNVTNRNGSVNNRSNSRKSARLSQLAEDAINTDNNISINLVDDSPNFRNGMEFDSYFTGGLDLHDFKVSDKRTQAAQLGHMLAERMQTANYDDADNRSEANFDLGHAVGLNEEAAIIGEMSDDNAVQNRVDAQPIPNWSAPDENGIERPVSFSQTRTYGNISFTLVFGVHTNPNTGQVTANYRDLKGVKLNR